MKIFYSVQRKTIGPRKTIRQRKTIRHMNALNKGRERSCKRDYFGQRLDFAWSQSRMEM